MLFGKKKGSINRILIVEDEPLVAFDNEHFLQEHGYAVVATVDRVEAALAVLEHDQIDLILLDLNLSDGGEGADVARAADVRGVPVLLVTGSAPDGARSLALGCLAKPYAQRDLQAAIEVVDALLRREAIGKPPHGLELFGRDGTPA